MNRNEENAARYAIEAPNGTFNVVNPSYSWEVTIAHISKTSTGWRVFTHTSTRNNSRTSSATPEIAAAKYFSKKLIFIHATK